MSRKYEIKVFFSQEDKGYIAVVPELPGCSAFGKTPQKALKEAETAMELWLEAARKEKRAVPQPLAEKKLSGKFPLRLPKELQEELAYGAREQGISLNQYMLYILARYRSLGAQVARRVAK